MRTWEAYRSPEPCWVNEYGDEVRIKRDADRYLVRHRPARSDIVTTVMNGRKDSFPEAVEHVVNAVMRNDRINDLEDRSLPTSDGDDRYDCQAVLGECFDPGLLSPKYTE